jgi:hypothetical protein
MSDRKVRRWALKFDLDGDELYRRTADDLLLKCLGPDQARLAMVEVHEGICGTHQSAPKMKWLLRQACFNWATMIADCFRYYKGCEEFQKHEDVQLVPAALLHQIIKPWPFRGWGLDFIGPPWAHYLGGYQDRLLGGPLRLPDLRCTVPDGVKHKGYGGEVLG